MKKLILIGAVIAAANLGGLAFGAGAKGDRGGNGGGGVVRNGQYMTFYSAGLYVLPVALEATGRNKVPQLQGLIDFVAQTPYLSDATKATLLNSLQPSLTRKYYQVDSARFTKKELDEIKAQYGHAMHIDAKNVQLYAVTDPESNTTYLLPDFYKLSQVDQKAILYHEAYWILHPQSSYTMVIQAESAFQAFLENPYVPDNLMNWLATIGTAADQLTASIRYDLSDGALGDLLENQNQIPLEKLFGDGFFKCKEDEQKLSKALNCTSAIEVNLINLSRQHPNSALIPFLRDEFAADAVTISTVDYYSADDLLAAVGVPFVGFLSSGLGLCDHYSRVRDCYELQPFELGLLNLADSNGGILSITLILPSGQTAISLENYYFKLTN